MTCLEDRAASEVIGAVIIFAFLVLAFSIYQGVVIPNQNRAIEFEHNQAAQDSVQDLRNAIRGTATAGTEASVSISLGARYPPRVLGINPGVSAGSLRTESLGTVTIRNISATDSDVADYFGRTTTVLGPFESKVIVYRPLYTHYGQAPVTRYENTLAYNAFPSGVNLSITDQAIVDGRKLTLIALSGNLSEARQGTVTVDTQAVSTATSAITVTNETGPINITIPTRLSAADWTDLLEDELTPDGHVTAVRQTGPNQVSIILEPGEIYELRLAKVGVGSEVETNENATYITRAEGNNQSIVVGHRVDITAEVRDRFNNPKSGVNVTFSLVSGDGVFPNGKTVIHDTTDQRGLVSATFQVKSDDDAVIQASFDDGSIARERTNFTVQVSLPPQSSGRSAGVIVKNAQVFSGADKNRVDVTFENLVDADKKATDILVSVFYDANRGSGVAAVKNTTIDSKYTIEIGGEFLDIESDPLVLDGPAGTDTVVTFRFKNVDGGDFDVDEGDFFLLTFIYGDGSSATYLIVPRP